MTLLSDVAHRPSSVLLRRRAGGAVRERSSGTQDWIKDTAPVAGGRVFAVQRVGAVSVGLVLLVFGTLGASSGVAFLTTHGERFLGMSSNGLLSALSLVVAAVLLGAALRGPRTA